MIQPPSVGPMVGAMIGGDSVEREGQAALLRRKRVGQNGLRHRLKSAAARALNHAEQDQHRQAGRDAAQQRAER